MGFKCSKCKCTMINVDHWLWKDSKRMVKVAACTTCYHKARKLKAQGCKNKNCCI